MNAFEIITDNNGNYAVEANGKFYALEGDWQNEMEVGPIGNEFMSHLINNTGSVDAALFDYFGEDVYLELNYQTKEKAFSISHLFNRNK